jgi:hypothetical protein
MAGHRACPHPPGHPDHPFTGMEHPEDRYDRDDCLDPNHYPNVYEYFLQAYPWIRNPTYRADRGIAPLRESEWYGCSWCYTPNPPAGRPIPHPRFYPLPLPPRAAYEYCKNCNYRMGWYVQDRRRDLTHPDTWVCPDLIAYHEAGCP